MIVQGSEKYKKNNEDIQYETGFTVEQTNIAKGIACILLLFHHLFYNAYEKTHLFTPLVFLNDKPIEGYLSSLCKICVAVFLVLSGYGVAESIDKKIKTMSVKKKSIVFRICFRLLFKLWSGYAVIYLLFVPWQPLFERHPYRSILDGIIDFMGLAELFQTPTMNETWWFMSVAIFSYLIAPFFYCILKYKALAFNVAIACFGFMLVFGNIFWCCFFMFGMILSKINFFEKLSQNQCSKRYKWMMSFCFLMLAALLRFMQPYWMDGIFALSIILFSYLCVSEIKFICNILQFIGKHSANIFMFHTFIYYYNFTEFIYAPKYAPLILLWLLIICILISVLIEDIKKVTYLQKGIDYISRKIEGNIS